MDATYMAGKEVWDEKGDAAFPEYLWEHRSVMNPAMSISIVHSNIARPNDVLIPVSIYTSLLTSNTTHISFSLEELTLLQEAPCDINSPFISYTHYKTILSDAKSSYRKSIRDHLHELFPLCLSESILSLM